MPTIQCPECSQKYKIGPAHQGKVIDCRKCGRKFRVPKLESRQTPQVQTEPKPVETQPVETKKTLPPSGSPAAKPSTEPQPPQQPQQPNPVQRQDSFFELQISEDAMEGTPIKREPRTWAGEGAHSSLPDVDSPFHHVLIECIQNFGRPSRSISWWDRQNYLKISKPLWLYINPFDKMKILFRNLSTLWTEGVVVWGYVVQANSLLFEPGDMDCPGEVLYSLADPVKVDPLYLEDVAGSLYSLKGTRPTHHELQPIAEYLTSELTRVYGLQIPGILSPRVPCRVSTTFFVRKHLPGGQLSGSLLPLIVNPKDPFVALPLPGRYWPFSLARKWGG